MLARTAFVDELSTWRLLLDNKEPLVLVTLDPGFAAEVPGDSRHAVIVPVVGTGVADLAIPPVDAGEARIALEELGLKERRAEEAARLGRRSLTALRRSLALKPSLHVPPWATPPIPRAVRAVLIAGGWADVREADRSILAALAGEDYESFREKVASLSEQADPLALNAGGSWHLVSPFDAWLLLTKRLTPDDFGRLRAAAETVLGEDDPALDMALDDRWKAAIEGKVRQHSADLRRGIARTLALLGVHGGSITVGSTMSGTDWVGALVGQILSQSGADLARTWAGLSDVLPYLAEAAPDSFLAGVRNLLSDEAAARAMFTDVGPQGISSPNSPHTALLWSLETLAWSPDHLGAVADLLARLSELDPGGTLSNRPSASLASIFCAWHPGTSASGERRLKVVDGLRKRFPDIAWQLMISMLPEMHAFQMPTYKPEFHDWAPANAPVTYAELYSFVSEVVARCIQDAPTDAARWVALIERYEDLGPADGAAFAAALKEAIDAGALDEPQKRAVWDALRSLVQKHREYYDAAWALGEDALSPLDEIIGLLTPTAAVDRFSWLFAEHMPHLDGVRWQDDREGYEAEVESRRIESMNAIEADGGFDAVLSLSSAPDTAWTVGLILAKANPVHDGKILELLSSDDAATLQLARAYIFERFRTAGGLDWYDGLVAAGGLSGVAHARLLLAIREPARASELAAAAGSDVEEAYWREFSPWGLGDDLDLVLEVCERLLGVGRTAVCLDCLGIYARGEAASDERFAVLAAEAMQSLRADDAEARLLSNTDLQSIIDLLERHRGAVGVDRLGALEWRYLAALGFEPSVPTLFDGLAQNPDLFVEVITAIYGKVADESTTDADESTTDDQAAARARNGYQLLSSWKASPGLVDGKLDQATLHTWYDAAVAALEEVGRLDVGLVFLGHALAWAPPDAGGSWPCEALRDFLEDLQNDRVEDGIEVEVYNSRGVTTRGPEDGGTQEMALVDKYRSGAENFNDAWPRSAALLRRLANGFEADARRNEQSAERFRKGLE